MPKKTLLGKLLTFEEVMAAFNDDDYREDLEKIALQSYLKFLDMRLEVNANG